jgi:hypothetical protein
MLRQKLRHFFSAPFALAGAIADAGDGGDLFKGGGAILDGLD